MNKFDKLLDLLQEPYILQELYIAISSRQRGLARKLEKSEKQISNLQNNYQNCTKIMQFLEENWYFSRKNQ